MKTMASKIRDQIDKVPAGTILRQKDLDIPTGKELAAAQSLSRLVKEGNLARIQRGLYYKPEITKYGTLLPRNNLVLNSILNDSQGYVTGTSAFNKFGITTQIPATIIVAGNGYRPARKIGGITVKYRRAKLNANKYSTEVLQILDALRALKKISDTTPDEALSKIIDIITDFPYDEKLKLLKGAERYNPSVRALVCAIFDLKFSDIDIQSLSDSLNPFSSYKLGISDNSLPNKKRWKIR